MTGASIGVRICLAGTQNLFSTVCTLSVHQFAAINALPRDSWALLPPAAELDSTLSGQVSN